MHTVYNVNTYTLHIGIYVTYNILHTHTHTDVFACVCVCVCVYPIYICIYIIHILPHVCVYIYIYILCIYIINHLPTPALTRFFVCGEDQFVRAFF